MTGAGTSGRSPRRPSSAPRRSPRRSRGSSRGPASSSSAASEQLEQPRAHDGAVAPDAGDLVQVEVELGRAACTRSPRRRPASGRTRSRCGPSSRSARRRTGRRARSRPRGERVGRRARAACTGVGVAAHHQAVALLAGPRCRRRRRRRRSGCPAPRLGVRDAASRGSSSCRRRRSCRRARAGRERPGRRARCSPAGIISQTPRRVELDASSSSGRCATAPRVVRLHVVPVPLEPLRHAAAHAAEPDHCELHQRSPAVDAPIRLPRSRSEARSPAACAGSAGAKPNGCPGIGELLAGVVHDLDERPVVGASLVELARRVQVARAEPWVTTQPVCARTRRRLELGLARAGSTNAWMAM